MTEPSSVVRRQQRPNRSARRARRLAAAALLCAASFGCGARESGAPAADESSRRQTASGPVVGFQGDYGNHAWLGIPYAKAPVGDLRWRAPQPPTPWTDTRVALEKGSPCVQYVSPLGGGPSGPAGSVGGSEDCLFLNIYAPRVAPDAVPRGGERWPVMVWIHGGGNTIGEAGFYNGGNLAATEKVVVVAVNYRLGPFGWLRHAALRAGADSVEQSGNFALLDLIGALTWVHENIAAFGGDPNNVTIFGESAGGRNVYSLLVAPQAQGLFHRAISQSGGAWTSTPAAAEHFRDAAEPGEENSSNEALVRMLVTDGSGTDPAAARTKLAAMTNAEVERYLRGKTAAEIMAAYPAEPATGMIQMPQVFADGTVVPTEPALQRFARADGYNRVPVMAGTTLDEHKLFMVNDPDWVNRYLWIVMRLRDERMYNLSSEYLAAMWKATGADMPAAALAATQPDVYVYRFDWSEEPTILGADFGVMLGAAHVFDIPFVFGHFDLGQQANQMFTEENAPGRRELSKKMMSYWAQFARTGSPGRGSDGSLAEWQAWSAAGDRGQFMVLDTEAGGGTRMSSDTKTVESVLAAVDADPRLGTPRDRCAILQSLARRSGVFTEKEYAARGDCGEFPFGHAGG